VSDTEFKVGDRVAIEQSSWGGGSYYRIYKIVRETPTQFVLDVNIKVYKKDNTIVGDPYVKIEKVTDEIKAKIHVRNLISQISTKISDLNNKRNRIQTNDIEMLEAALTKLSVVEDFLFLKESEVESE
jgi:hypothetical protein